MITSRRSFLVSAGALSVSALAYSARAAQSAGILSQSRYGPLLPDSEGILDLPKGFSYSVASRTGALMADGLRTPARHDGMATFPHPSRSDQCIIICNHEVTGASSEHGGAFAADNLAAVPADRLYDFDAEHRPLGGGTTTLVYDLKRKQPVREYLSLAGTMTNCAGGPTPWGSWLSCEETEAMPSAGFGKPHGFVFEVPSSAAGPVEPRPLVDLGRFKHEAAAVDPATGIVYMTEDQGDGLIYRFLPAAPGRLHEGGRLQALAIRGSGSADLRNWTGSTVAIDAPLAVHWVDLDNVTAPEGDLRIRGAAAGAALFARGEGMAFALGAQGPEIYFACTSGGPKRVGQIWRYRPAVREGTADEQRAPGALTLVYESSSVDELDHCDNLVAARHGFLMICEDGDDDQYLRILERDGRMGTFARNAMPQRSEFCGACFSPDGQTMFVNIQEPGLTLAITGPWQ